MLNVKYADFSGAGADWILLSAGNSCLFACRAVKNG